MTAPVDPGPFLPPVWQYPEQVETIKAKLEAREAKTAYYLNQREVANYPLNSSIATGQQWAPTSVSSTPRNGLRRVVQVGPLVVGVNNFAHNIPLPDLAFVTRLYGTLVDAAANLYLPLPYVSSPPGSEIQLRINGANVELTTPIAYASYSGYVVIEYLTS